MKKIPLLILFCSIGMILAYAWYFHASIYWKLGNANVQQPWDVNDHTIGNDSLPQLTYVAIGDSLTAGVGVDTFKDSYPYVLAQKIASDTHSILLKPFAVPGVRSVYVLNNFIDPVIESKPDIVTLFIGTNDIHGNVTLSKFEEHYSQILATLTEETDAQIYAINLPYIGTKDLISLPYRYYFNWRTKQYNEVIKKLATQYNVTYIDLYTPHTPYSLNNNYYAGDFFHPNGVGYTLWAEFIYAGFNK